MYYYVLNIINLTDNICLIVLSNFRMKIILAESSKTLIHFIYMTNNKRLTTSI